MVYILTNIHAAVNFGQYDEYTYPPNMPFRLAGKPPTSKVRDKHSFNPFLEMALIFFGKFHALQINLIGLFFFDGPYSKTQY